MSPVAAAYPLVGWDVPVRAGRLASGLTTGALQAPLSPSSRAKAMASLLGAGQSSTTL